MKPLPSASFIGWLIAKAEQEKPRDDVTCSNGGCSANSTGFDMNVESFCRRDKGSALWLSVARFDGDAGVSSMEEIGCFSAFFGLISCDVQSPCACVGVYLILCCPPHSTRRKQGKQKKQTTRANDTPCTCMYVCVDVGKVWGGFWLSPARAAGGEVCVCVSSETATDKKRQRESSSCFTGAVPRTCTRMSTQHQHRRPEQLGHCLVYETAPYHTMTQRKLVGPFISPSPLADALASTRQRAPRLSIPWPVAGHSGDRARRLLGSYLEASCLPFLALSERDAEHRLAGVRTAVLSVS